MARTGRTWKVDQAYGKASFPRDVCIKSRYRYEVIAAALGSKSRAVAHMEQILLKRAKARRQLLNPKYHRVGVSIARGHGIYFLTVDLLG